MSRLLCVSLAAAALSLIGADESPLLSNSQGMKFALIPAGKFLMGSPAGEKGRNGDEQQHEVTITRPYYLAVREVTQGDYEKVMGHNPSWFAPSGGGKQRVEGKSTADFPVETVSWHDATEFCRRLAALPAEKQASRSYRLPTEAEWEYACRGGTTSVFHYGDDLDAYKANFCGLVYAAYGKAGAGPFLRRTTIVADYRPNAFGLYDMHGNVQEWCQDWYGPDTYALSPAVDPQGPATGTERVLRGGGWPHSGKAVRSAIRNKLPPEEKHYSAGFRVVMVPR